VVTVEKSQLFGDFTAHKPGYEEEPGFIGWDFRVPSFGIAPIYTAIFLLNSEEWKIKQKPLYFQ